MFEFYKAKNGKWYAEYEYDNCSVDTFGPYSSAEDCETVFDHNYFYEWYTCRDPHMDDVHRIDESGTRKVPARVNDPEPDYAAIRAEKRLQRESRHLLKTFFGR